MDKIAAKDILDSYKFTVLDNNEMMDTNGGAAYMALEVTWTIIKQIFTGR